MEAATELELDLERKSSFKESDSEEIEYTAEEERRLRRKFDFLLIPPLAFLCVYACNVANAKTAGWDKDIHLKGDQYYILVMIFYVSFCLSGTPMSLLVKRFSAARVLPILMVGFGSMSLLTAAAKNFSEIFAIRWFLGMFESSVLPSVVRVLKSYQPVSSQNMVRKIYYLSTFYTRGELASRLGLFYAASSISGAFSGMIAYGVPLASVNNFLPQVSRCFTETVPEWLKAMQIVASLHFSTVKTNLYTVAPNIAGTVALLLLSYSSDYFRERSIHTCLPLASGLIGFIILGTVDAVQHVRIAYFACFCLTCGAFSPTVLMSVWYTNNTHLESQRAVVAAVMVAVANSAGLISTNVFRAQDEPRYIPALATSASFSALCIVLVLATRFWMRWENARRNREQGVQLTAEDVDTSTLAEGPASPLFRYMY
ncbi:unnamed protein product [Mycena citricolor]|uniref:MFS general substrate transporter n=1 Tax=Mycena citricolor TaxID=2018698 RepID=A0AAD2Q660_9AGAR|nr:unnamed protein product [Mycena citricolor]